MAQLREDRELTEEPACTVNYYPAEGTVGLIEFLLDAPEQQPEAEPELPAEEISEKIENDT